MALYTMGDLHLSLGEDKPMEVFGGAWDRYMQRLEENFSLLQPEDVTVLCGDLSWGTSLEESLPDFQMIHRIPGKKILVKGNHDYWWDTATKMKRFFTANGLDSLEILHNNCFFYGDYALCGTRGWFYEENAAGTPDEKILKRELGRLETSFRAAGEHPILCFLHYPPLYQGYQCQELLDLLKQYRVEHCYYGHLHGPVQRRAIQGEREEIRYSLVSADYLQFQPKKILDF